MADLTKKNVMNQGEVSDRIKKGIIVVQSHVANRNNSVFFTFFLIHMGSYDLALASLAYTSQLNLIYNFIPTEKRRQRLAFCVMASHYDKPNSLW